MNNIFSRNLKFLRKRNKETQATLALQLEKTNTAISNWELEITEPSINELLKLSRYYGISVSDLLEKELEDAHLNDKLKSKENLEIAHPNAHLNAHLNALKEPITEYKRGISKSLLPLVVTVDSGGRDNIVHVPIKARAGYLIGYGDPSYIEGLYSYNLPGMRTGTYRSFEVEGLSMKPTLNPHDWIVGQCVENFEQIRENRVHVIVTKNDGILIKRVLNRINKRGKLYLKSDTVANRSDYPIIEMDPSEIAEIWYANIKFSSDFSEPSEIFTRLNDLELDVMELKKTNKLK